MAIFVIYIANRCVSFTYRAWIQQWSLCGKTFLAISFAVCVTVDFSEIFPCEIFVYMKGRSNQLSEPFSFQWLCWHDWNLVVLGQIAAACEQMQEELDPLGRWNPEPLIPQTAHFGFIMSDLQIAQYCIFIWDFKVLLGCHIWEHNPKEEQEWSITEKVGLSWDAGNFAGLDLFQNAWQNFNLPPTSCFWLILFICLCRLGTIWGKVCAVFGTCLSRHTNHCGSNDVFICTHTLLCSQQLCWVEMEAGFNSREYRSVWLFECLISLWVLTSSKCL